MGREKSCLICSNAELCSTVDAMLEKKIRMIDIAKAVGCGKSSVGRHSKEHFSRTQLAKKAASLAGGSKRQFNPAVNRIIYSYPATNELFLLEWLPDEYWRYYEKRTDLRWEDLLNTDVVLEVIYQPKPPPREPVPIPEPFAAEPGSEA